MTRRVIAAVISQGNAYLVCQRPAHKRHGGLWEFPGGKVEPGESDFAAAERELREELGVQVTSVGAEVFSRSDDGSQYHIAFLEVSIAGEPRCYEHSALRWEPLGVVSSLPLAPSDAAFVAHLEAQSRLSRP